MYMGMTFTFPKEGVEDMLTALRTLRGVTQVMVQEPYIPVHPTIFVLVKVEKGQESEMQRYFSALLSATCGRDIHDLRFFKVHVYPNQG